MKELIPCFFQGFLILFVGVMWALAPRPHPLAVVDMNALIAKGSQELLRQGKSSTKHVHEWGNQLKEDLESYAGEQGIILLTKGAVVGGNLPDVTDAFLERFEGEQP